MSDKLKVRACNYVEDGSAGLKPHHAAKYIQCSLTGCPDDDVRNEVAVDVGYVQGVSEAGGDPTALTMLSSRHLYKYIFVVHVHPFSFPAVLK